MSASMLSCHQPRNRLTGSGGGPAAGQPGLDRARRQAELGRDLGHRQPGQMVEDQHLPLTEG